MRITDRVICILGKNKSKTGTIIALKEGNKPYCIAFDDGTMEDCTKGQLLEIDDMPNCGNIEFEKGMKIYSSELDKIGEVLECTNPYICTIKWLDGSISSDISLDEEKDYILINL